MTPEFFTNQDFNTYSQIVKTPYDSENPAHRLHRDFMVDNLGRKVKYWANEVVDSVDGFTKVYHGNFTNQVGITGVGSGQVIKNYVWAMISTPAGHDAGIYFTVEINGASGHLQYKLDYDYRADRNPAPDKKEKIKQSYNYTDLVQIIPPAQLVNFKWKTLISQTVEFIREHRSAFEDWIAFVTDKTNTVELPRPNLVRQDPPPVGDKDPAPKYNPDGQGRVVDFEGNQRRNADLGTLGEELVEQYEKDQLTAAGYHELADKVRILRETDGEGYDVESYYPEDLPRKKLIEVKTTEGPADTPFFLSRNELAQAKSLQPNYSLYRVYNYNRENGTANFYEDPNFGLRDQDYQLVPVTYLVYRR